MENFVNKGDDDQDIVNISDFDGSDADGIKSIGFRGGVIGEFYRFIKQLKTNSKFDSVDFTDEEVIQDLWAEVSREFIPDGWTMMIGLNPEFEANFANQMGEFSINDLTPNYVREQEYDEDYDLAVEYILKHYTSVFDFKQMPELQVFQEKQLAKLRPEPEKEEGEEEDGGAEEGGEEEAGEGEEESPNGEAEEENVAEEAEEEQDETDPFDELTEEA
jgi:hypothetical protein